jgi:hypothetical protein
MNRKYVTFSLSRKLSWYDKLAIRIDGVKIAMTLLDWYKNNPCAVLIDNVEQKGPYISPAVYGQFMKYRCECEKARGLQE